MILSKEKISRNQKLWQSIFLQLLRNNVTLNDNFLKSLIKLSERDEHESYKILLVNIILLALFDKFWINISHEFKEKRLFDLYSAAEYTAQSCHHKFEFSFLHVGLIIIAEQIKQHLINMWYEYKLNLHSNLLLISHFAYIINMESISKESISEPRTSHLR